jgi:hypothetical protein
MSNDPKHVESPFNPNFENPHQNPNIVSRRNFLGAGTGNLLNGALTGTVVSAEPQNIQTNARSQRNPSASDAGPENDLVKQANPNTFLPPATDHGEVETFWRSFPRHTATRGKADGCARLP